MNIEKFVSNFCPVMNKATPDQVQHFSGIEHEITSAPPTLVWTCIDSDGIQHIVPGYHRINRMYHVLTRLPWTNENTKVTL